MKRELLEQLAEALSKRIGGKYTCPICRHEQLMVACNGLFINVLHENDLDSLRFGPSSIPTFPIICTHCGYITQHAVAVFLPEWEKFLEVYKEQEKQ